MSTANQDPLLGYTPIIGIDLWEHAFYLGTSAPPWHRTQQLTPLARRLRERFGSSCIPVRSMLIPASFCSQAVLPRRHLDRRRLEDRRGPLRRSRWSQALKRLNARMSPKAIP